MISKCEENDDVMKNSVLLLCLLCLLKGGHGKGQEVHYTAYFIRYELKHDLMESMNLFLQEAYSEENKVQGDTSGEALESSRVNSTKNSPKVERASHAFSKTNFEAS